MTGETLYEGHGWKLLLETARLPDGRTKTAPRAHVCDTVHVLAFDDAGRVLLLREFRPFYGEHVWMLPSGKMDKETDPLVAADRELREETGFRAMSLRPYCTVRNTERLDYLCHVFVGEGLERDPLPQDATEMIEVHAMPVSEALEKVLGTHIQHSISALALLRWERDKQN